MNEYVVRVNIDGVILRVEEVYADNTWEARQQVEAWAKRHFPLANHDNTFTTVVL